jgi:uncharacterized protein
MPSSEAHVATGKPAAYMKQLCRHFGHRSDVSFDDHRGQITFCPDGVHLGSVELDATSADFLILRATAAADDDLGRVERIAGSHLERFGRRDGLAVRWSRPDAGR